MTGGGKSQERDKLPQHLELFYMVEVVDSDMYTKVTWILKRVYEASGVKGQKLSPVVLFRCSHRVPIDSEGTATLMFSAIHEHFACAIHMSHDEFKKDKDINYKPVTPPAPRPAPKAAPKAAP